MDMTSTHEKAVQTNMQKHPLMMEDTTNRVAELEEVKVCGSSEKTKKQNLNSGEVPRLDKREIRFQDMLQKQKMEDTSKANMGWRLRTVWKRFRLEVVSGALLITAIWFLFPGSRLDPFPSPCWQSQGLEDWSNWLVGTMLCFQKEGQGLDCAKKVVV